MTPVLVFRRCCAVLRPLFRHSSRVAFGAIATLAAAAAFSAPGEAPYVTFTSEPNALALVQDGHATPLIVDAHDWAGVLRVAHDLQDDIERVTRIRPALDAVNEVPAQTSGPGGRIAVIIGTIDRSPLIDRLVRDRQLDVTSIRGRWESWVSEVVSKPLPGIDRALVIAGSDKRGTIYGAYDLSQQIGVSPWYWWADVTPDRHDGLFVRPGRRTFGEPVVKYRGIFLNDEAPDLTNWIRAKFGDVAVQTDPPIPPGIANYGHAFYARIFEVLLRLRGNYLWPAMWNNAFNEDDPENARLADEYGIVMGTSHQEPMLRAQKEWDRRFHATLGSWNYAKQPDVLESFWREGVRRNRNFENLITLGLRGANDTEMAPGGPEANRTLLEHIVDRQRAILREEVNGDLTRVPQLWCLYKEVQDYYEAGMRVPDDVTLLWAEDNWGNLRRVPTADEQKRRGGAGIYYHFDYHGGPRSYQWLNTSPLPKIWEQMSLAHQYGADRIWIVNVGHFKGYEVPTEFFLNLAWNPDRWTASNLGTFLPQWAIREFGPAHASEIAEIVAGYAKFNGRRKPELLAPNTYSLVNYDEAARVVADYRQLATRAEQIGTELPERIHDAFYQLVLFPTKASSLVNELYFAAGRNALYAAQGRASAAALAAETRRLFEADVALMNHFNHDFAGEKWAHFMDQTHLGYTTWRDPPKNSLDAIPLAEPPVPVDPAIGVAIEGSADAWPGSARAAELPEIDSINQQSRWIEVFNRGRTASGYRVTALERWLRVNGAAGASGAIGDDQRVNVTVDWESAPKGLSRGTLHIEGAGASVTVSVPVRVVTDVSRERLTGFVENDGVVAIEPAHFTRNQPGRRARWSEIPDYGRTLSGMRADAPPYAPAATPPKDAPCLEYRVYFFRPGPINITAITSPTLAFLPDRDLRYAISVDDEAPRVVTLVPRGYRAQNSNSDWEKIVADNARSSVSRHELTRPGYHLVKVWMVDPGVVLQKLVIDHGRLPTTYLGPPESARRR